IKAGYPEGYATEVRKQRTKAEAARRRR
ncbi:MAG: hypothetical protein QOI16_2811, partial [Pseudonocardiales bacterium]|nr:hypothetical protein [Pseudonocardiales bacterium]